MKKLYKLIIFVVVFQFAVIIVNATGVFPNTLYSDAETEELRNVENPIDILPYLFELPKIPGLSSFQTQFTFGMLVFIFLVMGAAIYRATHSITPLIIVIIATSFVPMLTKSLKFFNKLFYNWDSVTLSYMAICLGVGVILLAVITILETPTHGDV